MTATEKIADIQALIDYVTTLSRIHGQRISIFTVPPGEEGRFTHVSIGFGNTAMEVAGYEDDLTVMWKAPDGTPQKMKLTEMQKEIGRTAHETKERHFNRKV